MSNIGLISIIALTLLLASLVLGLSKMIRWRTMFMLMTFGWTMFGFSDLLHGASYSVVGADFLLALLAFDRYRRHEDDDDENTRDRRLRAWSKTKLRSFAPVRLRPIERSTSA